MLISLKYRLFFPELKKFVKWCSQQKKYAKLMAVVRYYLLIAGIVGYSGELVFDTSKPDGTPRKLLDVGRLSALGWTARISLEIGIRETYADFLATMGTLRGIGTAQT